MIYLLSYPSYSTIICICICICICISSILSILSKSHRKSDLDDSVGYWYIQSNNHNKEALCRVYYSIHVSVPDWLPTWAVDILKTKALESATAWVKVEAENEQIKLTKSIGQSSSNPIINDKNEKKKGDDKNEKKKGKNPLHKIGNFIGATGKKLNKLRKAAGENVKKTGTKVKNLFNLKKHLKNHQLKKLEKIKAEEEAEKLEVARETLDSFVSLSVLAGIIFLIFCIIYGSGNGKKQTPTSPSAEKKTK